MNELVADSIWVTSATAFWLGVLTSISPCPLASNIAAISYLGRGISSPARVLAAGISYTLGRVAMFAFLGWLVIAAMVSVVGLSNGLLSVMNQLLGPLLIIVGMFLLELLRLNWRGIGAGAGIAGRLSRGGLLGALALGALFALSFCPVSAALFFGSLIPLAVSSGSPLAMPSLYGAGTGLPVLAFAALVGFGGKVLSRGFHQVAIVESWARRVTGAVFILVGLYYTLNYVFEMFS